VFHNSLKNGKNNYKVIKQLKGNEVRPNQSLKLTELAVDDFAAREFAENEANDGYVRAANYMEPAVRRRSLAPVR
jgi:hypothetical protein